MSFHIVIPARYASSRLPGKPMRDIAGKPMIAHVVDCALQSKAEQVIVATDDERIARYTEKLAITVCMTDAQHRSGTERIGEVIDKLQWPDDTIIVNLQGDEPLMPAACLNQVARVLEQDADIGMSTLRAPIESMDEIFDTNVIKLVCDKHDHALYFSRAAIPWNRDSFATEPATASDLSLYYRHIGLYAYRAGFVKKYLAWGSSQIEEIESLEQLRILYQGEKIKAVNAEQIPGPEVNTEAELKHVTQIISERSD